MNSDFVNQLFYDLGKKHVSLEDLNIHSEQDVLKVGATRFKKHFIPSFSRSIVVSSNYFANSLFYLDMAKSKSEAEEMLVEFKNISIPVYNRFGKSRTLEITTPKTIENSYMIKITK